MLLILNEWINTSNALLVMNTWRLSFRRFHAIHGKNPLSAGDMYHLAPVFQTLPCDTCHRHLAGSFRASCSGFCKVKSSYQKMCGMSKKFYRGNSWQNSWRNTRRGNSHRKSPEKSPEEFTETYRTEGGGIIGRFTVKVVPIPASLTTRI